MNILTKIKDFILKQTKNIDKFISSKFFIRLFLIIIAVANIANIILVIKTGKPDSTFALGMMGFVAVLIKLKNTKELE